MKKMYSIYYNDKHLISTPAWESDDYYESPEAWAECYASESGLSDEYEYCPSLLEVREWVKED